MCINLLAGYFWMPLKFFLGIKGLHNSCPHRKHPKRLVPLIRTILWVSLEAAEIGIWTIVNLPNHFFSSSAGIGSSPNRRGSIRILPVTLGESKPSFQSQWYGARSFHVRTWEKTTTWFHIKKGCQNSFSGSEGGVKKYCRFTYHVRAVQTLSFSEPIESSLFRKLLPLFAHVYFA